MVNGHLLPLGVHNNHDHHVRFVKDPLTGQITELRCSYDPNTRSGSEAGEQRKVKGVIHWVSATHGIDVTVRLYDRLFLNESPEDVPAGKTFLDNLNPDSLQTIVAKVEPSLRELPAEARVQFERNGYFCVDAVDSKPGQPVFNRIVPLRDSWSKLQGK